MHSPVGLCILWWSMDVREDFRSLLNLSPQELTARTVHHYIYIYIQVCLELSSLMCILTRVRVIHRCKSQEGYSFPYNTFPFYLYCSWIRNSVGHALSLTFIVACVEQQVFYTHGNLLINFFHFYCMLLTMSIGWYNFYIRSRYTLSKSTVLSILNNN